MWEDPIVAEVRKRGEQLAEESGGDLHKFFNMLRSAQRQYTGRLTSFKKGQSKPSPILTGQELDTKGLGLTG
jgi:hypothetical protein